ncbi:MAG: ATP synthase F0 subunit B [Bryobacteraceae bacterium]
MDATLNALADLLLEAIPTAVLFLFLVYYLKKVFFIPVANILEERRKATEGVRELSRRAFEAADKRSSEFETALQLARADLGQANEALRRHWDQEEAETIAKAHSEAAARIEAAKHQIEEDIRQAEMELQSEVEPLSEQIVSSLLRRRAA